MAILIPQQFWKWFVKINERTTAIHALLQETNTIEMNDTSVAAVSTRRNSVRKLLGVTVAEPTQITASIHLQIAALEQANRKFKDCLRDLLYIKGLQMYGYSSDPSSLELNPETCPVDHATQKWGFLPCDHFFCANCCSKNDHYEFSCSICSKKYFKQSIRFIDMQRSVIFISVFIFFVDRHEF